MEFITITKEDVLSYCSREEDHFYDKKAYGLKGDKVQKIATALANADGGEFVVGVSDDKENTDPIERWNPADKIEKFNEVIQNLELPDPTIQYRCQFLKYPDIPGYVLHVAIEKGLNVHETSAKKVFVRSGAQSLEIKGFKINELSYAKGQKSYEDMPVHDASIDDLESSCHLKKFVESLPLATAEPLDTLLKQNLLDSEWNPKVASILLFHENPSSVLPKQCAIRIARYETSSSDPDRDDLTDDIVSVEGPLIEQINEAYETLTSLMSKHSIWSMNGLTQMQFPKETIWELLVNAVIHRDYSISDNIFVGIYSDRIEIKSPGKLPGYVKVKNILDNRFSRNSKLVRLLSRYPSSPNKDLGEGINTAFQKMTAQGKKIPEIKEEGNFVIVQIYHASSLSPEEAISHFAKRHGSINNRQARDVTGIRESSKISSLFSRLREKGLLEKRENPSSSEVSWSQPSQEPQSIHIKPHPTKEEA